MVYFNSRFAKKSFTTLFIALLMALPGCGGGGGGGGGAGGGGAASSFTAAATVGELLTYTVDLTALTYSYTITDSAYGLVGKTGSGTLIPNADGSYRPAGFNARIRILPNGILIGAILENFGAGLEVVPIFGLDNPATSLSTIANVYNFVSIGCDLSTCSSNYGTFQITSGGTWTSCATGNIAVGGPCLVQRNGTLASTGGGQWRVLEGAVQVGTAIAQSSGGQEVLAVDLDDISGIGRGLVVGVSQANITTSQANGTWDYNGYSFSFGSTSGNVVVSGTSGTDFQDGQAPAGFTLTYNSPWTGFATTGTGGHGLLAGTGVYVFEQSAFQYASIGVKR